RAAAHQLRGALRETRERTFEVIAVFQPERVAVLVVERQREARAVVVERTAFEIGEAILGATTVGARADVRREVAADIVLAEDDVDHAPDRAAAVDGRGGRREDLNALDRGDRN